MKTRVLVTLLGVAASATAFAQENDDMYFNSKDRVKSNELNNVALAKRYQQEDMDAVRNSPVNPSDTYSGRGVNPEYLAQGKNGTTVVQNEPDYFLPGYQPKGINGNLYQGGTGAYANPNNCNCANNAYSGFGSPYGYNPYSAMYSPYGNMGGMYSPYSSMYSPYSSMYSPYGIYGSGMSMGMNYGFGTMGSMMGMGIGYTWGSPMGMYGMNYGMPYYGGMYGMGMGGYGGYGYYPTTVVVTDSRHYVNSRHPSRSSSLNNYVDNTRSSGTVTGATNRTTVGGRASGQPNYYDSGWRNNASNYTSRSAYSQGSNGTTRSSWGNSAWDSGNRSSFGSGSRGSFGGGFGGGSTGGGGGGHSRGRH